MNKKPISISITKSEKIGVDQLIDLALEHNEVRITRKGKPLAVVMALSESEIHHFADAWHQIK
jgi:PHD/YefM family antitoxin component YafN of YafNO toxin-antitoxin module